MHHPAGVANLYSWIALFSMLNPRLCPKTRHQSCGARRLCKIDLSHEVLV